MPRVIELLVKHEHNGQVWYSIQPVAAATVPNEKVLQPSHLVAGVQASTSSIDHFPTREPE